MRRAERPGEEPREVEDADARERAHRWAGSVAWRRAARPGRRSPPARRRAARASPAMRSTSWSPSGASSSCSSCFSSGCVSSLVSTGISSESAISSRLRSIRPAEDLVVAALLSLGLPSAAASSRGCAPCAPAASASGDHVRPPGTCATAWCARGRRRASARTGASPPRSPRRAVRDRSAPAPAPASRRRSRRRARSPPGSASTASSVLPSATRSTAWS